MIKFDVKNFFKENKKLCISLFIALCIIIFFIFKIYDITNKLSESRINLNDLKERINRLNMSRPSPTKDNLDNINKDIRELSDNISEMQPVLGNIYVMPLYSFIDVLNKEKILSLELTLSANEDKAKTAELENSINKIKTKSPKELHDEFISDWNKFVETQKKSEITVSKDEIFRRFIVQEGYTEAMFESARKVFAEKLSESTSSELVNVMTEEFILKALGVPFNITPVGVKNYTVNLEQQLNNTLKLANVALPNSQIVLFDEFTTVPTKEQVPSILEYCTFFEDFYVRIAKSEIESIVSYKKISPLLLKPANNFITIEFEISIVSQQNKLRKLLNNLQSAYEDNRIYDVSYLDIARVGDNSEIEKNMTVGKQLKVFFSSTDLLKTTFRVKYIVYSETH